MVVEEAGMGIEKACLNRLRESRLKSETRTSLIHILSCFYENPNASQIFSPPPTRLGGGSCEGDEGSDGGVMKVDVVEDLLNEDVKDDEKPMEFSVDEFENLMMDIDVDAMEELFEGNVIDQQELKEVEDTLLETASMGHEVEESGAKENGFSNVVEVDFAEGEAVRSGKWDDKCSVSLSSQLDETHNGLECGDAQRKNGSDDTEEGEIDNVDVSVHSHVLVEDTIDTLQENEYCVDQSIDTKRRKLPGEVSCPEFAGSVFVDIVNKDNGKYNKASSDACAENGEVKSPSEAKTNASIASAPNDGCGRPVDSRIYVFYGDIFGEATPPPADTLIMDADHTKKKKKRGGSKEKKKIQKRKKRAEMDKKRGVKRMKLPAPLKPKVVKVCEYYLKGRCLKGEECSFSHDATPLTKSKACIHFARNNCMKGDACPYGHELWKYPCDNYTCKGVCSRGSSCLFSHEISGKEGSPGASIAEKDGLQSTPIPGAASKGLVNSAAKLSVNTPLQIPRGLSFLAMGKSGSDHPSRSPQKVDLMESNHSNRNVPGVVKTSDVTSIPFATPVRSNNVPYPETQSDHSSNKNNSVSKAFGSGKRADFTNPLDQAFQGLNSLISSKVPVKRFNNEWRPGQSTKEHNPPVPRLNGLYLHQSLGLSADKEKSGFQVVDPNGQTSKSNSQVVANICEGATQGKESGVNYFSSETSKVKPIQKLITIVPKDQKTDKKDSIQDRGRQSVSVNPLAISEQKLKSRASVVSPSSQDTAASKNMPPSIMAVYKNKPPSSQGVTVNQATPASVQKVFLSSSTLASKFESEAEGSSLGSAVASQLQIKPEIASRDKSSFNVRPVKASAILDFIFGTGSINK